MSEGTETAEEPARLSRPEQGGTLLFLLSSMVIGGSERKIVRLANDLHRRGWPVHVAYLNPPDTLATHLDQKIPLTCLDRKGKISVKAIRSLRRYLIKESVSRVVCVNLYPLLYAQAARRLLPSHRRPRIVQLVNTTKHVTLKQRMSMWLYGPLMRRADAVVFGCQAQREHWTNAYSLDPRRCQVIYNGIDVEHFSPGDAGSPEGRDLGGSNDFIVGTIGQLRAVKNQVELIRVLPMLLERVPNARLVLVGEGEESASLQQAARQHGVADRVVFEGQAQDVRPILGSLDVFVLTSISETFSNAGLEAMAMGKPVILSDTGGAREMVVHGVDGFIYPQGDLESLSGLLQQLADDPNLRSTVGRQARKRVVDRFSFDRMSREYRETLC